MKLFVVELSLSVHSVEKNNTLNGQMIM